MLNLEEIDKTILDLENHDTTFATCEKLAWLYIVRDRLTGVNVIAKEKTPLFEGSDFKCACSNMEVCTLLEILDKHMEVVKLLHPKEYTALLDKLRRS